MLTKSQKGLLLIAWATLLASTALLVWFRGYLGRELDLQSRLAGQEVEASNLLGKSDSLRVDFGDAQEAVERLMTNVLIENAVLTRRVNKARAKNGTDGADGAKGEDGEDGHGQEIPIVPYRLAAIASLEGRSWSEGLVDWRRVSVRSEQGELGALYLDLREGPLGAINLAIAVTGLGTGAVLAVLLIGLIAPGSSPRASAGGNTGLFDRPKGLYQLERYALMGEIASGLIHESSQPIFRIREHVSKLRDTLGEVAGASMPLLETENQIGQFLQIIDDGDLTALLSRDAGQRQPHDINQVLRDVLKLTGQARGDIRVNVQYGKDLPPVLAQPQYLVQSLTATLLTFFEIMLLRGDLECITEASRQAARLTFSTQSPEGEILMSPGAFDPFSAAQAAGSGLHLTVCRMIIEEMGGQVDVFAKPGGGVALTLGLPID